MQKYYSYRNSIRKSIFYEKNTQIFWGLRYMKTKKSFTNNIAVLHFIMKIFMKVKLFTAHDHILT